jgi:hypothetical protein
MLAFENVAGLPVIEPGDAVGPTNKREISACVLGVASRAVGVAFLLVDNACVIAAVRIQPLLYVHMTRHTLQLRAPHPKRVAVATLKRAFKTLMRPGQRSRRQLRKCTSRQEHKHCTHGQTQTHMNRVRPTWHKSAGCRNFFEDATAGSRIRFLNASSSEGFAVEA